MPSSVNVSVREMGDRKLASTGSKWEPVIGYSRAVRVGDAIFVTGTVGVEADGSLAPTLEAQARRALTIIRAAIEALGGSMSDVVRTRIYVTDILRWEEVGRAHGEVFGEVRPALTLVEVARLIDAAALVEIEADAVVHG
jgi:enamine deaminase RidA (YjgF/YER057c/UK114 family)